VKELRVRALESSTRHRRLRRTKAHMRQRAAHKCPHPTQYAPTDTNNAAALGQGYGTRVTKLLTHTDTKAATTL
jgi:hypothetical protein